MSKTVISLGVVERLDDETGGGRIKVRLLDDSNRKQDEIPYAFPLLPKVFHSMPKVGESVLVITTKLDNKDSQRYFIGPIISQPQNFDNAQYGGATGPATSVLQGSVVGPKESIADFPRTEGAFPDKSDVAIVGRKGEDIILRSRKRGSEEENGSEIDLRCGVRKMAYAEKNQEALTGPVVFNSENPVYIQMRYKKGLLDGGMTGDGVINLVADKINLISHQDTTKKGSLVNTDGKKNCLLDDADMYDLMNSLHNTTYGDILVPILEKICRAITTHVHNFGPVPPNDSPEIAEVKSLNLWSIISPYVRIS